MIDTQERIETLFKTTIQKDSRIHYAYLLVHSDKLGVHLNLAEGTTGTMSANADQRYLIASISKLFTSVLFARLTEQNKISYDDPIHLYVEQDLLNKLHIYKGTDYTRNIRISHLLGHTSGLNDFFEDKPQQGNNMMELILGDPSRIWTPQEVVLWSKENLKSHFPPGGGFHYSDTGYHLLGLIAENITSLPLHQIFEQYFFRPLAMNQSHMIHYSEPLSPTNNPTANVYVNKTILNNHRSLSIEFAGGGIVSTSEDLLKFIKALVSHEIISQDSFEGMKKWSKFSVGIDYGYGLVQFRTIPILMPARYNMWGNFGSTGSFLFYHPSMDIYLIGSLNQFRTTRKAIQIMFKTLDILKKSNEL